MHIGRGFHEVDAGSARGLPVRPSHSKTVKFDCYWNEETQKSICTRGTVELTGNLPAKGPRKCLAVDRK